TQTRPDQRYQTVQEFWDEMSAAAGPEPEELHVSETPVSVTSDLTAPPSVATVAAPPKPRFETSKELRQEQFANGARPRIVVPIAGQQTSGPAPMATTHPAGRVTVAVPVANKNLTTAGIQRKSSRLRALVVSLILIIAFAGMLLATRNYIRNRWARQTTTDQNTLVGREAVTTTDLNLRAGPSSTTDRVGLAESGSRVKVLTLGTNINWCEIQVTQHSRPKSDPASQDRGWVNKQFLRFD